MIGDKLLLKDVHYDKKDYILPFIQSKYKFNKLTIALGGQSGVGKTEIASLIQADLWDIGTIRCKVIHIDDYYKTMWQNRNWIRRREGLQSIGSVEIDWDTLNDIINTFHSGAKRITTQRIHKYTNSIEFCETSNHCIDILLVEGLYANHLKNKDYGIYLCGGIKETTEFRIERQKEILDDFRESVLVVEREDILKTKPLADLIVPFSLGDK